MKFTCWIYLPGETAINQHVARRKAPTLKLTAMPPPCRSSLVRARASRCSAAVEVEVPRGSRSAEQTRVFTGGSYSSEIELTGVGDDVGAVQ